MTTGRWPRVSELFEAALQCEPPARATFLNCRRTPSDLYLAQGLR